MEKLTDSRAASLVVMVAQGLPNIKSSGRITIVGSALDGAEFVESLGVINSPNKEIYNSFLNNGIRGIDHGTQEWR